MGWLGNLLFGYADPSPLYNGLSLGERRRELARNLHLESEKKKYEALWAKPPAGISKAQHRLNGLLYFLYFFKKTDKTLDKDASDRALEQLAAVLPANFDFEGNDWTELLNLVKGHPIAGKICANLETSRMKDTYQRKQEELAEKRRRDEENRKLDADRIGKIEGLRAMIRESYPLCTKFAMAGDMHNFAIHVSRVEAAQRGIHSLKRQLATKIADSWEEDARTG